MSTAPPKVGVHLLERLRANGSASVIAWRGETVTGAALSQLVYSANALLEANEIGAGSPVALVSDYSPQCTALLLALIQRRAIIAPLLPATIAHAPGLLALIDPKFILRVDDNQHIVVERREPGEANPLYRKLMARDLCGLVLFTSGSTGEPKGVVHDFARLLEKFKKPRSAMVTLNFLLFDHWGGLNTLLHCLSSGSLVVLPENRTSEYICELIERHKIELLPATPTFLNLILLSRAFEKHDMSSLRLITYGAETMPESTLAGTRASFPNVELRQTYGMIELGVLRAKSRDSGSLWVKIGGEGYDIRVVEGLLQIKADSAMLGYINAPSPFTEDGYLMTGDRVEVDGEYLKILGRDADIINVGGEKVYPAEVEAVLLECPEVEDAAVFGEANPITGQIVCAEVKLGTEVPEKEAQTRIKRQCRERLQPFKVPVRILFSDEVLVGDRLKRIRRRSASAL